MIQMKLHNQIIKQFSTFIPHFDHFFLIFHKKIFLKRLRINSALKCITGTLQVRRLKDFLFCRLHQTAKLPFSGWFLSIMRIKEREKLRKTLMQQYDVWNLIISWTNSKMDHVAGSGFVSLFYCFIEMKVLIPIRVVKELSHRRVFFRLLQDVLTFLKSIDQKFHFTHKTSDKFLTRELTERRRRRKKKNNLTQ